jgi:cytochrome c-type biogenesis protein CcmH/NrfG
MTYAKQLRDYENAVLQKRLEELADDEISALMEEIEIEEGNKSTSSPSLSSASETESSTSVSAIANSKE